MQLCNRDAATVNNAIGSNGGGYAGLVCESHGNQIFFRLRNCRRSIEYLNTAACRLPVRWGQPANHAAAAVAAANIGSADVAGPHNTAPHDSAPYHSVADRGACHLDPNGMAILGTKLSPVHRRLTQLRT